MTGTVTLGIGSPAYPVPLRERLGMCAPAELHTLGNLDLLRLPKTALFCSVRCPGNVILSAYDQAARWRDEGRCIISGFHSPVEQECLRILLRGTPPIILCPARALPQRIPAEWQTPLAEGRLLILSGFTAAEKRVTTELAARRNALVAALADEVCFAHITPGGQSDRLTHGLASWRVPFLTLEKSS
jgi:predicted Rossmann fold nucleotide-binding protein DprA/Smf involved in DNA uptake